MLLPSVYLYNKVHSVASTVNYFPASIYLLCCSFHQWSSPAALEGGSHKSPILSNLKRSFSSAFDRSQGATNRNDTTPKRQLKLSDVITSNFVL